MKNLKNVKVVLAASLLCVSSLAVADRGPTSRYAKDQYHHDRFEYARVIDVNPIYREVRISEPVEECWTESVKSHQDHRHPSAGGMLAGGIVGGIIGHHLGNNRKHRRLATAVGTLVGAKLGHEAVNGKHSAGGYGNSRELRETCRQTDRVSYQQQLDGYQVTYRFQGRNYEIEMPYHPGKRIKMRIQATPVI